MNCLTYIGHLDHGYVYAQVANWSYITGLCHLYSAQFVKKCA